MKNHHIRHELIQHLQAEKIGTLKLLTLPSWFVEGMAYALSEDPRTPLTAPFEKNRKQLLIWHGSVHKDSFWQEAGRL